MNPGISLFAMTHDVICLIFALLLTVSAGCDTVLRWQLTSLP
jgi:hypothetical protein